MNFEVINRLRLKEAFGEFDLFQHISKDEEWLDILFECDTRGQLFVYDDADVNNLINKFKPNPEAVGVSNSINNIKRLLSGEN